MGIVHRYKEHFDWDGVPVQRYPTDQETRGASVRWLIGPAEKAPNFALRYFEVAPGGYTALDQHPHDHGVMIMRGQARVVLGEEEFEVAHGDVVYVPPNETHQFKSIGEEPLGFLCVIPALERSA